jgi:DNA (cytosine-5)-methyltransferase 1
MAIPVIDLFAGPGGLGEGFSSVLRSNKRVFDIRLSIEMDINAHKTLELRSLFRQFPINDVPDEYYAMIKEPDTAKRKELHEKLFGKYKKQAAEAREEAWCIELGNKEYPPELVDNRIKKALNGEKNWLLIGGPPCQAYSLVGRSRRQWGEKLDNEDKRVHLYKEYLRIIARHHPAIFVMENVKGLLSSRLDDEKMFDLIKRDLQDPSIVFRNSRTKGYRIFSLSHEPVGYENGQPRYSSDMDYLIRAEEYKVPQRRHRVILLGIREDISVTPGILEKSNSHIPLDKVIGDLPKIRSGLNRSMASNNLVNGKKKRIYQNLPDSDENWLKIIHAFREEIHSWNGFDKDLDIASIPKITNGKGAEYIRCKTPSRKNPLYDWYYDPNLQGIANHESRSHLVEDLKRYMFSSLFTEAYGRFPRLHEFETHSSALIPDHENVNTGKFADRFRVQISDQPATTITSHISKDGHYFIHYDPEQCRSLTVREAARIQTFPDNYLFCGSRTAQFHQVGNAVPPYLAKQIAELVLDCFEKFK